ncbi:hypothetical protein L7F22_028399 [Adiantum nelumboides]|nr:hypothetical protein [Adiantum nelumboides]
MHAEMEKSGLASTKLLRTYATMANKPASSFSNRAPGRHDQTRPNFSTVPPGNNYLNFLPPQGLDLQGGLMADNLVYANPMFNNGHKEDLVEGQRFNHDQDQEASLDKWMPNDQKPEAVIIPFSELDSWHFIKDCPDLKPNPPPAENVQEKKEEFQNVAKKFVPRQNKGSKPSSSRNRNSFSPLLEEVFDPFVYDNNVVFQQENNMQDTGVAGAEDQPLNSVHSQMEGPSNKDDKDPMPSFHEKTSNLSSDSSSEDDSDAIFSTQLEDNMESKEDIFAAQLQAQDNKAVSLNSETMSAAAAEKLVACKPVEGRKASVEFTKDAHGLDVAILKDPRGFVAQVTHPGGLPSFIYLCHSPCFEFRLRVMLGPEGELGLTARVRNVDSKPFSFTVAFQTYFAVTDISEVRIEGLETLDYLDNLQNRDRFTEQGDALTFEGEVDRVYLNTPTKIAIIDHEKKTTFVVKKDGLPDAVVWNPWERKAKALADFGDDEYKHTICLQPAAIEKPITLKPGEEWKGRQKIITVYSSYHSGRLDPMRVLASFDSI